MKKLLFLLILIQYIKPYYKPSYLWDEAYWGFPARINTKIGPAIRIKYGSTKSGQNNLGEKTNVLNIYGNENLYDIARAVPQEILDRNPTSILNTLWQKPFAPGLGQLTINSQFSLLETNLDFGTGITKHWSTGVAINFFKIKFNNICYNDLTPKSSIPASIGEATWDDFFKNFVTNMNKYGMNLPQKSTSSLIKEFEFSFTYAQEYKTIAGKIYWSTTVGSAILIGISNADTPLALGHGLGYNKPFIFSFSAAVEPLKWLIIGATAGGATRQTQSVEGVRMKTFDAQNGLIKLTPGLASVNNGTLGVAALYAQVNLNDRWNISGSYAYNTQSRTKLIPKDKTIFETDIVNTDSVLDSWSMRSISFSIEHVIKSKKKTKAFAIDFNIPLNGRNIFNLIMSGVNAKIKWVW